MRRLLLGFCGLLVALAALAQGEAYVLPAATSAGVAEIFANRSASVAVFDYNGRRAITIIDFPSLAEQGKMFNRVVALIERMGAPRERVLGNEELAQYIRSIGKTEATLAYGNDFMVAELVVFFNLAELGGIQLNGEEAALRQLLLDRGQMVLRNGFLQAVTPTAVVLSVPQAGDGGRGGPAVSELARRTILTHELSHGEYYTNPGFANYCRQFWQTAMTAGQQAAFKKFLSTNNYAGSEELLINESQAYLMHTPDPRAFSAKAVGLSEKEIAALRKRFREGNPLTPPLDAWN